MKVELETGSNLSVESMWDLRSNREVSFHCPAAV
jgi:hypothetical protein